MANQKRKKRGLSKEDIINYAVLQGVGNLRESYGLEMDTEQLFKYLDNKKIQSRLNEIQNSDDFKRFRSDKRRIQFLYNEISRYIVENRPFDERGKKLLEGNLEAITGSDSALGRFFSTKKGRLRKVQEYKTAKQTAKDISYAVGKNPQLYAQEAPELLEAVMKKRKSSGRGALAEILYASGHLAKDAYKDIKSSTLDYSNRVLELAKKYVEHPGVSYSALIAGIVLVLLYNSNNITGSVVGSNVASQNSLMFFIGIALLCISGLSFIFRKKNNGKKKK